MCSRGFKPFETREYKQQKDKTQVATFLKVSKSSPEEGCGVRLYALCVSYKSVMFYHR